MKRSLGRIGAVLVLLAACSSAGLGPMDGGAETPDAGNAMSPDAGDTTSVDAGDTTVRDAGDAPPRDAGNMSSPDAGAVASPDAGNTISPGGGTAGGAIPNGLAHEMLLGLFEGLGATWMKTSQVPWQVRYEYLVKGWENNFGYGAHDGTWALQYMQECDSQGFLPAVEYYVVNGEPGGGEDQFLAKVQNVSTMASYFGDLKLLMQRAKDFGKPVLVLVEADGFGFLEKQTMENPDAAAAVASTGIPELQGLPDTVAGWGLAFLQMRQKTGASNVILGIHVSAWATGKDLAYFSVTDPLQPEVDKAYAFLSPLGIAPNQTGDTYDVLVGDPLDRDSDYYQLVLGQNRWWDMSDNAPISSESFNRYLEWVRLWNVKSGKRWVLWQIPLGNKYHLDINNDGSPRAGYKDNRTEYFLETNAQAHMQKAAQAGVVALLFGAGTGGQSTYTNDFDLSGQLYLKTHASQFFNSGGFPLQ